MELRYANKGFDLRSFILKTSARIKGKQAIVLKSGIQDCAAVLAASNVKGEFIEKNIAIPAWMPIPSLESADHEEWTELIQKFRPLFAKIKWEESISSLCDKYVEHFAVNGVIDAESISKIVASIFHEVLLEEEISEKDVELFYQASIEWRKEIAVKGRGSTSIKQNFHQRVLELLGDNMPYLTQPFILSPQINVADIFSAVGVIFRENPSIYNMAIENINNIDYLRGIIFESIRLYHPFPVLERELTNELRINGVTYPIGTQVFIMLDEFEQTKTVDPNSWLDDSNKFQPLLFGVGPRSCPGRKLAENLLINLLRAFLTLPREQFQPEKNLLYSGRINDQKESFSELLYQVKTMFRFMWR